MRGKRRRARYRALDSRRALSDSIAHRRRIPGVAVHRIPQGLEPPGCAGVGERLDGLGRRVAVCLAAAFDYHIEGFGALTRDVRGQRADGIGLESADAFVALEELRKDAVPVQRA